MGLRLKINLIAGPLVLATLATAAALDYRHEIAAIMDAHGMHAAAVSSSVHGPVPAATAPEAVARRSLWLHGAAAIATAVLVAAIVNITLQMLVLGPAARLGRRFASLARGRWADEDHRPLHHDEIGALVDEGDRLGRHLQALVWQQLHAERLATIALVCKALDRELATPLERLQRSAAALYTHADPAVRSAAHDVTQAVGDVMHLARQIESALPQAGGRGAVRRPAAAEVHIP